jgi:hypothetical protein
MNPSSTKVVDEIEGSGESPLCCGGSGVLLEARQRGFLIEHGDIGVHVCCVPWQRRLIRSVGLLSRLFLFASLFGPCLNMRYTRNNLALEI